MYTQEKHEGSLFFIAHKLYGLFIWHFLYFCYISFEDIFLTFVYSISEGGYSKRF